MRLVLNLKQTYLICFLYPTACYKPSLTAQYTEDSEWMPFDLLSRLVKEWEAGALLPENVAQSTKQVVVRPGMSLCHLQCTIQYIGFNTN